MSPEGQLALPLVHKVDLARAEFLEAPSNSSALACLARPEHWPDGRLALWGEPGCGKSHLLHRWAAAQSAPVLAGSALRLVPELPLGSGVALDDADTAEEEALLHCLNAASEAGLRVLLAAREAPARWPVTTPDLASRLRSITAIGIGRPEDSLLRSLLARLLADCRLAVSPGLQDYLLARLPRTQAAMRKTAARLDRATLAARSGVTRGLAIAALQDLLVSDPDQDEPPELAAPALLPPAPPSPL